MMLVITLNLNNKNQNQNQNQKIKFNDDDINDILGFIENSKIIKNLKNQKNIFYSK